MTRTEKASLQELDLTPEQLQERTWQMDALTMDVSTAVAETQRPALAEQLAATPTQPPEDANGKPKQTRLSVKQLRERYQERHAETCAVLAKIAEEIQKLKVEQIQAASECRVWAMALKEIDKD